MYKKLANIVFETFLTTLHKYCPELIRKMETLSVSSLLKGSKTRSPESSEDSAAFLATEKKIIAHERLPGCGLWGRDPGIFLFSITFHIAR
jgi:hypothetical protein